MIFRRPSAVILLLLLIILATLGLWAVSAAGTLVAPPALPTVTPDPFPDPALTLAVTNAIDQAGYRPDTSFPPLLHNTSTLDGWAFGTVAIPAPPVEDAAPVSTLFLARLENETWQVGFQYTPLFDNWLAQAPAGLISTEARQLLTSGPAGGENTGQFSLPWATGETWFLLGGPHHNCGWGWAGCDNDDRPWSALDFNGNSGLARSAGDGIVFLPCPNQVILIHGDGWESKYYHLTNITVENGQVVQRGDVLGTTSTAVGCGGSATGPHVHFALLYNGEYQEMHGQEIGGWLVSEGAEQYDGCMAKDGSVQCAPGGAIFNDGTYAGNVIGRAAWTAGENWQPQAEFETGDPLYWVLDVENEGSSDALVQLTYAVRPENSPPNSPPLIYWQGNLLTPPGFVSWGLPGSAGELGNFVFSGTVAYQGLLTSTHLFTYTVGGPTPTPTITPTGTISPTETPAGTATSTPTPSATPLPAQPACANPHLDIPDNDPAGISHSLFLTQTGTLVDLDVSLVVSHTWVGDLSFTLHHEESGTLVNLIDRPGVPASTWGCAEDNIDTVLDDASPFPVEVACAADPPAIRGTWSPHEPLAAFAGLPFAGTWTLVAADHAENDLGTLHSWCLLPTTGIIPTPTPETTPGPFIFPTATPTPSPTPRPLNERLYIPMVSK